MITPGVRMSVGIVAVVIGGLMANACSTATDVGAAAAAGSPGGNVPCTAANTPAAPATGLIADFADTGGGLDAGAIEITGGIVTYGSPPGASTGAPTYTTSAGRLHIAENAPATSSIQYVGLALYFDNCIDASAFTGIEFTVSGTFSGCSLTYATNDTAHTDATLQQRADGDKRATGPAGAYGPQEPLLTSCSTPNCVEISSAPTTVSMPFTGVGAPAGGSPDGLALDPTRLTSVQWGFAVPAASTGDAGTASCMADLTIDDIKFYH